MIRMNSDAKGFPVPVLLTVRELGSGGIERDVAKLAMGLDPLRFLPYVAAYKPEGVRYEELRKAGIPIIRLNVTSFKSASIISTAVQFGRFLKEKQIRLLHAFDPSAVFAVPLARLLRVPVTLTHTVGHRGLLDSMTQRQLICADRLADAVVVNCEAMRKHLIEDFAVSGDRIKLCYNGVNTTEFYPLRSPKPHPIDDASLVIGTVCVLRPEKTLEVLLEAFAKIRHITPKTKLLIVGDGNQLLKLKADSLRLGIQDSCIFLPAVASVAPLMRAMDIFVSCSSSEAFSNAILEAMACGCCVVGSRVGGTPELIEDEERGLLFTAGDAEELAQKLTRVMQDDAQRELFGAKAAEFAAKSLNIGVAVQRMMEIYETLLRQKNALG
jgi:glycosyltransferase involved in cell wall biosynthesis